MDLKESYDHLKVEAEALLSTRWPLVHNPFLIVLITIGYVYFVYYAGPRYMKDRPPFKLKTFILLYNLFQIFANAWIVKEHIAAGWFTKYGIKCTEPQPNTPSAFHIFNLMWWILLLKIFDYIETCVFVLRKKYNQISFLHVYHHVSVVYYTWHFLKYILDERGSLVTLVNCSVHVLMYTYYFLAAWSPKLQQVLSPFKSYITNLQMVQFIGFLIYIMQPFVLNCVTTEATRNAIPGFFGNILIYLYLFYDFYKKTYNKTPPKKGHIKKGN